MRRIGSIAAGLVVLFLGSGVVCYALGVFTEEQVRGWLEGLPQVWMAVAIFGLLAADLALPVPSSVLLAFGGWALGWHIGSLVGAAGMLAGNLAGYWLCRLAGRRAFEKLVGPGEAERFGKWLVRWGPAAVIVSRLVPAMAETLSCLAGLGRMHAARFTAALILGTVPVALFFSVLGAAAR